MICTSSHQYYDSNCYTTYAISGNCGKDAKYLGKCFPQLAPKLSFWKVWHDNIGLIDQRENNKYYIDEYYKQVLKKLDPKETFDYLDNSILLCYEGANQFCHRHIVSAWFELTLGVHVPDLAVCNTFVQEVPKDPEIKNYLKEVMIKDGYLEKENIEKEIVLTKKM